MKKGLLFLMSLFMMVSTFGAMESTKTSKDVADFNPDFYSDETIEFRERGIKFYVFLDGTFDFNTATTAHVDYIERGRRSKRRATRGIRIEHDYQGRVRRIGNVFISYSYNDKVKRIGSVFIKYNRGRMHKVGHLKIKYSYYGVQLIGNVKRAANYTYYQNPYYSYGWSSFNNWNSWDTWEYSYYDSFFDDNDFYDDYENFNEDDDFYYYRSKTRKGKRTSDAKVIKRKKAHKSKRGEKRKKITRKTGRPSTKIESRRKPQMSTRSEMLSPR